MGFILFTLLVSIGINLIMFVPAFKYKTDKITDISYAVTFIVVALYGYLASTKTLLHKFLLVLVLLWALRIGTFLFIRINKMKVDVRFNGMRERLWAFLQFWILQGATVFVVMLAASLAFMQKLTAISITTKIGVVIFLAGLAIEATADAQKFRFNNDPKNKGKWINTGIWKICRHPNYLGEMMVWIGIYYVVASSLGGLSIWFALISPIYIICLLMFVSGVPLLEKSGDQRWGSDPKYLNYKKQVPVVVPTPNSISVAIWGTKII